MGDKSIIEVLRGEKVVLSLSRKDDTNLPQGNKWHPCGNMGQLSLEGPGFDNSVAVNNLFISQIRF